MDIKQNTTNIITVKVTDVSPLIDGKWGPNKKAKVVCDGTEYETWVKEKDFDKFSVGNTLTGTLKFYQGKPYREWFVGGTAIEKLDLPPAAQKKEVNLPGRGQSFGLAFHFCLKHKPTSNIQIFLEDVIRTADKIVETQNKFVNGE